MTLYVRSRGVPAAAATALVTIAALCAVGTAARDPGLSLLLMTLAAGLGASLVGPGLGGASPELERTAAISWPRWRSIHLLAGTAAIGALLAGGALLDTSSPGTAIITRDVAGLSGLVALGAATIGAARSWMLPIAWAVYAVMVGGPTTGAWYAQLPSWPVQPAGTTSATVTAATLLAVGTLTYAMTGSRR